MEDLFGHSNVVQAGITSTAWEGIAENYIQKYEATVNVKFDDFDKEKLLSKIVGVVCE